MSEQQTTQKYMAFISYSHADNREEGRKWADWLHTSLETYEIPDDLVGKENKEGNPIPRQIFPVFQDEKELSASSSLSDSLEGALDNAENLILLCSPRSARSKYVQDEVRHFKKTGKTKNIIALILSGEPQLKGNEDEKQCFPELLRYAVTETGEIDFNTPEEPIAADVRLEEGEEGFTSAAAYRHSLEKQGLSKNEINSKTEKYKDRLDLAKLKIISGILKVPLGELTKRDKEYELRKMKARNKRIKQVAFAIGLLAIAAVIMGIVALKQRNNAQNTLAHSLYESGVNRIVDNDIVNGSAYLAAATRLSNGAANMFCQSLLSSSGQEVMLPDIQAYYNVTYSPTGKYLVYVTDNGVKKGKLIVWDAADQKIHKQLDNKKMFELQKPKVSSDEKTVFAFADNRDIISWNMENNAVDILIPHDSIHPISTYTISDDDKTAYLSYGDKQYRFYDIRNKKPLTDPVPFPVKERFPSVTFSPDSRYALVLDNDLLYASLYEFYENGAIENTIQIGLEKAKPAFSGDGKLLAFSNSKEIKIYSVAGKNLLSAIPVPETFYFSKLLFNPDNKTIALTGTFGWKVYDINTGREVRKIPASGFTQYLFKEDNLLSPDQTQKIKAVNNQVFLQNLNNTPMLYSQFMMDSTHRNFELSGDNKSLYTLNKGSRAIEKWDLAEGKKVSDMFLAKQPIEAYEVVKDGGIVYTITEDDVVGDNNFLIRFWDEKSGSPISGELPLESRSALANVSSDGSKYASRIGDKALGIFSAEDGKVLSQYDFGKAGFFYVISPQLNYAFTVLPEGDFEWALVDMAKGKEIKTGKYDMMFNNAGFSDDGKIFVLKDGKGKTSVWDVAGGKTLFETESSQTMEETLIYFNRDNSIMIMSDDPKNFRLWDIKTGKPFGQKIPNYGNIMDVYFSKDGKFVYILYTNTFGEKGTIYIYDVKTGYPVVLPFGGTEYNLNGRIFKDGKSIMTINPAEDKSRRVNIWEVPGQMNVSNKQLATDLENLFGRRFNLKIGAVDEVLGAPLRSSAWYFQDPFLRTVTPTSSSTIIDMIHQHIPVKNEADVNYLLTSSQPLHPLSRAALAVYYSKDPITGFQARRYIQLATYQLSKLKEGELKQEVASLVAQAEKNLKK